MGVNWMRGAAIHVDYPNSDTCPLRGQRTFPYDGCMTTLPTATPRTDPCLVALQRAGMKQNETPDEASNFSKLCTSCSTRARSRPWPARHHRKVLKMLRSDTRFTRKSNNKMCRFQPALHTLLTPSDLSFRAEHGGAEKSLGSCLAPPLGGEGPPRLTVVP